MPTCGLVLALAEGAPYLEMGAIRNGSCEAGLPWNPLPVSVHLGEGVWYLSPTGPLCLSTEHCEPLGISTPLGPVLDSIISNQLPRASLYRMWTYVNIQE